MKRASVTKELTFGSSALDRLTGADKPTPAPLAKKPPAQSAGASLIKLSVFLRREEDAYLENLSSTAKFSGGKKLSKTGIVAAMVRAFRTTSLDVRGVKNGEELYQRLVAQLPK